MDALWTSGRRRLVRAIIVPLVAVAEVAACAAEPTVTGAPRRTSAVQPISSAVTTGQADSTVAAQSATVAAQSASSVAATGQAESTVAAQSADAAGLVTAEHPQCDVGAQILQYLQTGDNGGDPQLDVHFANYVGVPAAQARALADQAIQQCDQQAATQEASQAYAESTSLAAASASAARAQQDAAIAAQRRKSCASIGGRVDHQFGGAGACASTVPGDPSGQPGAECASAYVSFSLDGGTLDSDSYKTAKHDHAGCFR